MHTLDVQVGVNYRVSARQRVHFHLDIFNVLDVQPQSTLAWGRDVAVQPAYALPRQVRLAGRYEF
ncbi:hypothetical protein [Myxococcus virescens]|uniref:TonB-dependent receptor-like beta-barrel domain-containing protein n=1 Tax=Myxococcus virescens TaxID=83456 RepID=A0A511HFL6_9BACT|nr:hypothetical protein [Myxococcus virescens]GEL72340.1 hypothetical protein MVI01_41240 [Myxococcus virescens]SDF08226.1 hypothetical protein SAMN04488504_11994 [Myxococcus virescens]